MGDEHYCDDHADWEYENSEWTGELLHDTHPILEVPGTCQTCGREMKMRFAKQGVVDADTGEEIYGP